MDKRCVIGKLYIMAAHPKLPHLRIGLVCGKQVVVGNHYDQDTLGIYIPAGAIVPDKLAEEMWVKGKLGGKQKNRVVAKERDGVMSEGLFYGSRYFTIDPMVQDAIYHDSASWNKEWKEGQDVTEEIGVTFDE